MRINRSLGAGRGRRRILTSLFASVLAVGATVLPATPAFAWTCKANALTDPSDAQIQALLDSGPSTVTFYGKCEGNFIVSRAITLVGSAGAIVEGDGGGSVFDVQGSFAGTATFRSLKITAGNGAIGSGIYITDATVVLDRVNVYENEATDVGGGVFADAGSSLTITGSVFRANEAYEGGAIFAYSPRLSITGSSFLGNVAEYDGGAISYDADGGASILATGYIPAPAPVTISRSTFSGNVGGDEGGAIEIDSASAVISGSTFSRNSAPNDDGGAIDLYDQNDVDPTVTITSSTFTSNVALGGDGGAIYAYSLEKLAVTGSRFTGNRSYADQGGAIASRDTGLVVTTSSFTSNVAEEDGGAISVIEDYDGEGITIDRSTFTSNVSINDDGGAVATDETDVTVTGSTFTRNVAGQGDDGGALWIDDEDCDADSVSIASSRFVSNFAQDSGGAVFVDDGCDDDIDMLITGSTFTGNATGDNDGGAIFAEDVWMVVRGSTFSGNRSGEDGGAVSVEFGGFASDARTVFSGNRAVSDGGAVELDDMQAQNDDGEYRPAMLFSGRFIGNVAGENGGAIDVEQCAQYTTMELSAVTIERNSSGLFGGGVHVYEDGCGGLDVLVYDDVDAVGGEWGTLDQGPVSISYNKSVDPTLGAGGGMFVELCVDGCAGSSEVLFLTVDDDPGTITIQRNSAADAGGLYLSDYTDVYLDRGVLVAYNTYGGVYDAYCDQTFDGLWDATFTGNTGYDYTC